MFIPFHGSRDAAPAIPILFTLLFFSVYFVLQLPGASCSKQLFHYGESQRLNHTELPHRSLTARRGRYHCSAGTPAIVAEMLCFLFKTRVASRHSEPGKLLEAVFKPQGKSEKFSFWSTVWMQSYGGANQIQMIWNKLAQGFYSVFIFLVKFFFYLVFPALSLCIFVFPLTLPLKQLPQLSHQVKGRPLSIWGHPPLWLPCGLFLPFISFFLLPAGVHSWCWIRRQETSNRGHQASASSHWSTTEPCGCSDRRQSIYHNTIAAALGLWNTSLSWSIQQCSFMYTRANMWAGISVSVFMCVCILVSPAGYIWLEDSYKA